MNPTGISKLSAKEKRQLMEVLREDMRQKADDTPIPKEHIDQLNERHRSRNSTR